MYIFGLYELNEHNAYKEPRIHLLENDQLVKLSIEQIEALPTVIIDTSVCYDLRNNR